ncbi:alpha/beta hydrolase [Nesterenkonia natronophila]|uniref:Alpha/beta hydrolase n=2 Tax=Nesterenkonia natronophila TaxID=2174932 RepID=A0A3A4G0D8_9MICC|nr:alpha/beta hydrolase [Nesterenkonia natronophila]
MGAWIWEATARSLINRGFEAEVLTLEGLAAGELRSDIAQLRLEDHVRQLVKRVTEIDQPVVLVSHSYSSMVTSQVADRLRQAIAGLVHFGGFLPSDGRSLVDDWGSSPEQREQEKADIAKAGNLWMPPDRAMLEDEADLQEADRDFLADRFTPHPGHTITDPARMNFPVDVQPSTYVALSPEGAEQAWRNAPTGARGAARWRRRHISSGHWPMLSQPASVVDLLVEEIDYYALGRHSQ